jgi:hypothetical protein
MRNNILRVPSHGGEPIACNGDVPIAYEVLGVQLHLDELTPEDEDRFDQAMAFVDGWIGSRLKWAHTTALGDVEPYDPEQLEYVTTYPRKLRLPSELADMPKEQRVTAIGLPAQNATLPTACDIRASTSENTSRSRRSSTTSCVR